MLAMADDNTKIIPGHGAVASKADLVAYRDMLVAIVGKVEAAVKAGKSLEEVKAMKPADGFGVNPNGFIKPDMFVEMVYDSLKV